MVLSRYLLLIPCLIVLEACSGIQTSRPATDTDLKKGFSGYLYYPVVQFKRTTQTTQYLEQGRILAYAGGLGDAGCVPVNMTSYVTSGDFQHPWIMSYRPGLLETYKFGVEWTDQGTLKSANVESTPDQGRTIANLASAAESASKVAAASAPIQSRKPQRACNGRETIIASERLPWTP